MKQTGILAGACALAIGLSAFAETGSWFDAQISTYSDAAAWNTTEGIAGGAWTAQGDYSILDTATLKTDTPVRLEVDTDDTAPLAFQTAQTKSANDSPAVSATVKFNTFDVSAVSSLSTGDAKAGLIVVKTPGEEEEGDSYQFYGVVMNSEGDGNIWAPLSGSGLTPTATDLEGFFTVKIAFSTSDDDTIVSYTVDGTPLTYNSASKIPVYIDSGSASISVASFSGCGEVSALAGEYEIPTQVVNVEFESEPNFTVKTYKVTAGDPEVLELIDMEEAGFANVPVGTRIRFVFTAKEGFVLSGDTSIDKTVEGDITLQDLTDELPTAEAGKIKNGSKYYLTMADALNEAAASGDTIELRDNVAGPGFEIAKSVTIDFGTKTYTVTDLGAKISATAGRVTLQNGAIVGTIFLNGATAVTLGTGFDDTDAVFTTSTLFVDDAAFIAPAYVARTCNTGLQGPGVENGQMYKTFAKANAAAAEKTVYLRQNLTLTEPTVFEGTALNADLNSCKIILDADTATLTYADDEELLSSGAIICGDNVTEGYIVKYDNGVYSVGPEVVDINLDTCTIAFDPASGAAYTGSAINPSYTVKTADGETTLTEGTDFTAAWDNDNAPLAVDTYTLTITAVDKSGYTGRKTVEFSVTKALVNTINGKPTQNGWTEGDTPVDAVLTGVTATFGNPVAVYYTEEACQNKFTPSTETVAGTYWVRAEVAGTDNYAGAQSAPVSFVVAAATPQDWPANPEDVANQTAGDAFGAGVVPKALQDVNAKDLAVWAKNNNVDFSASAIKTEAFLLNCANDDDEILEAKATFVIPSITIKSDGSVVVADPTMKVNGTIIMQGKASLSDTEWAPQAPGHKFFRATLVPTTFIPKN